MNKNKLTSKCRFNVIKICNTLTTNANKLQQIIAIKDVGKILKIYIPTRNLPIFYEPQFFLLLFLVIPFGTRPFISSLIDRRARHTIVNV